MKTMKALLASALGLMMVTSMMPTTLLATETSDVAISQENFPDVNFREYVKTFDENKNSVLEESEINNVTNMDINGLNLSDDKKIERLDGIENFVRLSSLDISNNNITELELDNPNLKYINCFKGKLTELTITSPNLLELYCYNNELTKLTVTSPNLENLYCYNNELTELTITSQNIEHLDCSMNELTTLNVNSQKLGELYCAFNNLTSLDISNYPNLQELYAFGNFITNIDTSNNPELEDCCYAPRDNEMDVRENFDYTKVPSFAETLELFNYFGQEMTCEGLTIDFEKQTISLNEGKDYGRLIFENRSFRYVFTFYYGKNPNQPEVKPDDKPIVKPEAKPETKPADTKKPVVAEDQKAPQTSDSSNVAAYMSMLLIAAATAFGVCKHREVE